VNERSGDQYLLTHALRELAHALVLLCGQAESSSSS
jgi:hypothetical protein